MKRLVLSVLLVCLALMTILPACGGSGGGGGGSYSLVGTWQVESIDGIPVPRDTMVWVFKGDGTGTLSGGGQAQDFIWSLSGDRLTLTGGGESDTVPLVWLAANKVQVVIDGDVFILCKV